MSTVSLLQDRTAQTNLLQGNTAYFWYFLIKVPNKFSMTKMNSLLKLRMGNISKTSMNSWHYFPRFYYEDKSIVN